MKIFICFCCCCCSCCRCNFSVLRVSHEDYTKLSSLRFAMRKSTISFSGYKFPAIRLTTRCLCVCVCRWCLCLCVCDCKCALTNNGCAIIINTSESLGNCRRAFKGDPLPLPRVCMVTGFYVLRLGLGFRPQIVGYHRRICINKITLKRNFIRPK